MGERSLKSNNILETSFNVPQVSSHPRDISNRGFCCISNEKGKMDRPVAE
jgi:hypothetical protein